VLFPDRFRPTPRQYLRITQISVLALALIIVSGAAVRLTGSGLGCSRWPFCENGRPVAALSFHPMVEQINRFITGLVSVAVAVAVLGSLRRRPRRDDLVRWSWVLVGGVVAQILIGAAVTLSELKYSVVAVHFLVSMGLVWAAVVLMHRADDDDLDTAAVDPTFVAPRRRWTTPARWLVGLGAVVLVSGSMVTSAGKHPGALPDGSGHDVVVKRLPFQVVDVARVHSLLVWALCLLALAMAIRSRRDGSAETAATTELLVAIVAQGALGYVQYFSGVPALMVAFHVAGATLVWVMTLRVAYASAVVADSPAPVDASLEPVR
jgi:cytochrome c oxidase assembly protein subunit 15